MTTTPLHFGLFPISDDNGAMPRTVLPLKSVQYDFTSRGGITEVEMTQIYRQENSRALDCEYLFPLPADGAIYRCEATINGRLIRVRIEEKETARQLVAEKKAAGYRTALVESERDNLFTLSLGNLQPQDVIEVKLAYLQPLRKLAGFVTLDLPFCPGVRYIAGQNLLRSNRGTGVIDDTDQVPDASRITPPRVDGNHPDAAFIQINGTIDALTIEGQITSPSHPVIITQSDGVLNVTLAQGGEIPDRDLALRWRENPPSDLALRGWITPDRDTDYALLELRAPSTIDQTGGIAQDYYFLIDRSGSMKGKKWQKAIEALQSCVALLHAKDRAMVTFFESTFQDFDAEPTAPAALLSDVRFQQIVSLGTAGGTEMAPALRHVITKYGQFSRGRTAALILITDAAIGNEREICALLGNHPQLPVHCFCIDSTVNDALMIDLVRQQGGTFHPVHPNDDIAGKVTHLGNTLRKPGLVDLRISAGWEYAASGIPNLYAGQTAYISLKSTGAAHSGVIQISGRDPSGVTVSLECRPAQISGDTTRLKWHKERLVTLIAKDEKAQAIELSKASNLLCPLTSFVAWDESAKVSIANHLLVQPALDPLEDQTLRYFSPAPLQECRSMAGGRPILAFSRQAVETEEFCSPVMPEDAGDTVATVPEILQSLIEKLKLILDRPEYADTYKKFESTVYQATTSGKAEKLVQLFLQCTPQLANWMRLTTRLAELKLSLQSGADSSLSRLEQIWRQQKKWLGFGSPSTSAPQTIAQEIDSLTAEIALLEKEIARVVLLLSQSI